MLTLYIPCFAELKADELFDFYFCMGDSIPNTAHGDLKGSHRDSNGWVDNTYPALVSQYFGITDNDHRYNGAHAGWRVNEVRYLLEDDYEADEFMSNAEWTHGYGGFDLEYLDSIKEAYREALKKADLVTINLGNNDVVGNMRFAVQEALEYHTAGNAHDQAIINALQEAKEKNSDMEALVSLIDFMATLKDGNVLIKNVAQRAAEILSTYGANWDALIKTVLSYVPQDATIVVIGMYNPAKIYFGQTTYLSDCTLQFLYDVVDPGVERVNRYFSQGSSYSSSYLFVDVTDIDMTGVGDGTHPGRAGHKDIADRVYDAVDKAFCDHSYGTTLVNAKKSGFLRYGYSGDVQCNHCGVIVEQGHLERPVLLKFFMLDGSFLKNSFHNFLRE